MSRNDEIEAAFGAIAEKAAAGGAPITVPAPFAAALGMTFVDFGENFLVAQFPVDLSYANPLGAYLGGMLCALVDAVCGPLSYLACGKPATTTDFSMTFVRPLTARDATVTVRAEVVSRSRTLIVMEASAFNPRGGLVARARTTSFILDRRGGT